MSQGRRLASGWARLSAALSAESRAGFGLVVPDGMAGILAQQSAGLRKIAFALSLCGFNGIAMLTAEFGRQWGPAGGVLAFVISATYLFWLWVAWFKGGASWFTRFSSLLLVAQGAMWGLLIYILAGVAQDVRESNFVIAIAMALVSTPMLGSPFGISMAFWVPSAIMSTDAFWFALDPHDFYMASCFMGYELFTLVGAAYINRTILAQLVAQSRLQARGETVSLLLKEFEENAADWLWETDPFGRIVHVSARFAQVLRRDREEVEGRSFLGLFGADASASAPISDLASAFAGRRAFRDLPAGFSAGSETRWWQLSGRPAFADDGRFLGYRGVSSDVTDLRRADEVARHLASHDSLTGVGNRRMLVDMLDGFCAQRDGAGPGFSLLLVDLDRFKAINDERGHAAGDQVLVAIAQRLREASAELGGVPARLGGDEFAVLLPGADRSATLSCAERIVALACQPIAVGDLFVDVGASVGISMFPAQADNAADLMRKADLALYRAKADGRGRFWLFDPRDGAELQAKLSLAADLKRAVNGSEMLGGGLFVDYQPIIDLESGRPATMEALCRWRHPDRGLVSPSEFIPLAEETGLIGKLGLQVMAEACESAARWGGDVGVSVNLSVLQLKDPGLVDAVAEILRAAGIEAGRLELEVTESAWLMGDARTRAQLDGLQALGVRLVMDDFGSGFSSLSTLHSFRFAGLKVDAGFTRDLERDPRLAAIVRLVSGLARELGIALTAEGIETEGQLAIARSFGISRAQGFLIGRPAPFREQVSMLSLAALRPTGSHALSFGHDRFRALGVPSSDVVSAGGSSGNAGCPERLPAGSC